MKRISLIFVLTLIIACDGINSPKKPSNLIPEDQMVNVLLDISLINSAKGSNKRKLEENNLSPQTYIYNRYNIDSTQFVESNAYYSYNIEDYQSIYDRVNDSLLSLKKHYEAKEAEELKKKKKKLDSIKEAKERVINVDSFNKQADRFKKVKEIFKKEIEE